jgi:carbon starvation protein CstA
MLSIRHSGRSIFDVVGVELGNGLKQFMRLFSIELLLLVGIVFVLGPAKLLGNMSGLNVSAWGAIVFGYYFFATILPIQKITGRLYPLFGAVLIFMTAVTATYLFNAPIGFGLPPVQKFI